MPKITTSKETPRLALSSRKTKDRRNYETNEDVDKVIGKVKNLISKDVECNWFGNG